MASQFVQRSRWTLLFFIVTALLALGPGCGRSSLDDSFLDGGFADVNVDSSDAGNDGTTIDTGLPCGPATCPSGCCDDSGNCRAGTDLNACGTFGSRCDDCPSLGLDFCDSQSQSCGRTVPNCDFTTCKGCCEGDLCLNGTDPNECGFAGIQCQHCATVGAACDPGSGACTAPGCNSSTCSGCCLGDLCLGGVDPTACGRLGAQCQNCAGQGTTCLPTEPGGLCEGVPSCGPQNCKGCCEGNTCLGGIDQTACGLAGGRCQNCLQTGGLCTPAGVGGFCSTPTCGPQNCAGCCQGNTCVAGFDNSACGVGGQQCQFCFPASTCSNGFCSTTLCNSQNCASGCCIGDICAAGNQNTACGTAGQTCNNCQANNQVCQAGTRTCSTTCGPQNCNGCCDGNVCRAGSADAKCGLGGQACASCTNFGEVCRNNVCQPPPPPCNAQNCPGCCDPTAGCVAGFIDTRCGSGGGACQNCSSQGSRCDTSVSPRVCRNQQTTCPAPYPSCPAGVTTKVEPVQHVCTATDLEDARSACAQGPNTVGCQQFFQFEQQVNPACGSCLQPFDVSFQAGTGLLVCASPFLSPTCRQETGCAADCVSTSCAQCLGNTGNQCRNQVSQNQCASFLQPATSCVIGALQGPAGFCSPVNYQGNFGAWLQGAGGHYCGP